MATPEEICWLPLTELAPMIRRRELSPVEGAEALLAQIEALNPRLNAICTMHPERVRAAARVAEEAVVRGDDLGPLHGAPIAVKDLIFTDDHVTTGGSTFYREFVPDEDDVTVERLRRAGAVVLGKTNVPEFGYGISSQNPVFGDTRNPWNVERTPGGSSGGSAAAVASGMCPGALGSDGGGSIRVPASGGHADVRGVGGAGGERDAVHRDPGRGVHGDRGARLRRGGDAAVRGRAPRLDQRADRRADRARVDVRGGGAGQRPAARPV